MGNVVVHVESNTETLVEAAADRFVAVAQEAVEARGTFSVALSGGSTPRPLYKLLASDPWRERVDWSRTYLFWGDERTVPPDHADSNYRMVAETLLAGVDVPAANVHRVPAERAPQTAADAYEAVLRAHFGLAGGEWPRFDLMLLGLGDDGHTASLFPGLEELHEWCRLVVAPYVPTFETHRISVTIPVINHARHIWFLVSGGRKAETVATVIEGRYAPDEWPAQLVHPRDGTLTWLLDDEAAYRLS